MSRAILSGMPSDREKLVAAIDALDAQRALLGHEVVDAAIAALRARIDDLAPNAPSDAEQTLRQVSILFLDLVDSTRISQHLDPEEVGAVMDGALARGTRIVDMHRGRVVQYAGDSLLAVFGAQDAREDDAERAVRCGLDLLTLGAALAAEVQAAHGHAGMNVRVGVHTGRVLFGRGVAESDSIRGSAVNIAARMEQTAPSGGLRISHDTWMQVRGIFEVTPQDPLVVKGVEAPIATYLVLRAKPRAFRMEARGIEGVTTQMIGRDAELGALQAAFHRLVRPSAGLDRVLVVGEAGVGKSRLLDEFRNWADARAERFGVFQARATLQTQGQPYGMLRDLLAWRLGIGDGDTMAVARQKLEDGVKPLLVADESEADAEAHAHLIGQLIGLDYGDSPHVRNIRDDGRQIRSRAFHGAALALRCMASVHPVIVYLDDLHWADDGSLDFFEYLARAGRDAPLLLIGLARPALFERRHDAWSAIDRIDLHLLDRQRSRLLADELLQRLANVPAALRELIIGGADGNPFYMEELVKMLIDQRVIDTAADPWTVDASKLLALQVPPTLTGVLQARLDGLPPAERHTLQLASVIGQNFWDAALAHVDAAAVAGLQPLTRHKLVHVTDADHVDAVREYAFQHQLLHQSTYDTVLKGVKRHAHAKTAEWLADYSGVRARALLGTAAEHFEKAGEVVRAAELYARAAAYMAGIFANEAALDYTARALALAPADAHDVRWRLLATRERTLDLLGRRAEQLQDIDALLALAEALDDDARRGEAAWRRCDIALRVGDYATQEREARRALAFARRTGNDELVFRAIHRLAVAVARLGDPAAGRAMAEEGLLRARELGLSEFRMANAAAVCVELQGDLIAFLRYAGLSVASSHASGDRRVEAIELGNLGMAHALLGDFQASRRHLEEALRLNRAVGNRLSEGNNLIALSEISWLLGEQRSALAQAEEAVAIQTEVDSRFHLSNAFRVLANARLALGEFDEATDAFRRSEGLGREIGQPCVALNAIEGQARVALARGDARDASALAERLLTEAGLDASVSAGQPTDARPTPFAGAEEHLIRLTLHRIWSRAGDARAVAALQEAHRALEAAAATIGDTVWRQRFLDDFPAHREIVATWRGSDAVATTKQAAPPVAGR